MQPLNLSRTIIYTVPVVGKCLIADRCLSVLFHQKDQILSDAQEDSDLHPPLYLQMEAHQLLFGFHQYIG